jgi:hypothetical protein
VAVRPEPSARGLVAVLVAGVLWAAWGLARHPGFQPAPLLRIAAPLLALAIGGGFTRLVAHLRARVDGEREFDRGGKALFMGFVMVGATLVAWLLVSQAMPATANAIAGRAATEAGTVVRKVSPSPDVDCRFRLEVASASTDGGAVPRPLDECVDEAVWRAASEGGPVMLRLVRSLAGAELVGVASAGDAR